MSWIFVTATVKAQDCTSNTCNMICNSSFESGILLNGVSNFENLGCGNQFLLGENCSITGNPYVNGWSRSKGNPNLFVRGSQKADTVNGVIIQPYNGIPNNVYSNGNPVETIPDSALNDRYIGVSVETDNQNVIQLDGIVNQLSQPVNHSREYTFSFWQNNNGIVSCRNSFSRGQIGVMVDKIFKSVNSIHYRDIIYQSDLYEPDNNFAQSSRMLLNTVQYHTFHSTSPNCYNDFVRFRLDALTPNLIITTSAVVGQNTPNTILTLYDENFNILATNDDFNGTGMSRIVMQNLAANTLPTNFYYIRIENKEGTGNLHYRLSLYSCFDEQSVNIVGAEVLCENTTYAYEIQHNNSGVQSYTIIVPAGWKINGAQITQQTQTSPFFNITPNNTTGNFHVRLNGTSCNSGMIEKIVEVYPILGNLGNIQFQRLGHSCYYQAEVNPQFGANTYEWSRSVSFANFEVSNDPTCPMLFEEFEHVNLYVRSRNVCGTSPVSFRSYNVPNLPGNCTQKTQSTTEPEEIDTETGTHITLFPQPAYETLHLLLTGLETLEYKILDVNGKEWKSGKIQSGENTLSIQHLAAGIYLIKFSNFATLKFVKL